MYLQNIIKNRLNNHNLIQLASKFNYSQNKLEYRINTIINSPDLSLDKPYYDFDTTTSEFIRMLCSALEIPSGLCNRVIADIQAELTIKNYGFRPYIFIDTDFNRTDESILTLIALDRKRYIHIEDDVVKLPLNEQLSVVQCIIQEHYKEQPVLDFWGDVKKYVYYYQEQSNLAFSTRDYS